MTEEWRPVVGFEGFLEVSSRGRVRSLDRVSEVAASVRSGPYSRTHKGRILKPARHPAGYLYISLSGGGVQRLNAKVHHLVLEAFIGPRPDGFDGCHSNDIPDDNRIENLRWDTKSANMRDLIRNGRHASLKKTHCPQGHAYTTENTIRLKRQNNGRRCRACVRARSHNRRKAAS